MIPSTVHSYYYPKLKYKGIVMKKEIKAWLDYQGMELNLLDETAKKIEAGGSMSYYVELTNSGSIIHEMNEPQAHDYMASGGMWTYHTVDEIVAKGAELLSYKEE